MTQDLFEQLEHTLRIEGPNAGFDLLVGKLKEQKRYPLVFEARLMQTRYALGLPLIFAGSLSDVPSEHQGAYEAAMTAAARETGQAYLADGDIVRAWAYFRAIGEPEPVAAAIENLQPGEVPEPVLTIALQESVNPRKGFELLLEQRGMCEGIDFATQCADRRSRVIFLRILVKAFYRELTANVKEMITRVEERVPESDRLSTLIAGRNWLFDSGDYYIENSHLASILQASPQLDDPETMRLALELADYGRHLLPIHHFRADPPFEDPYVDLAEYVRAQLGENVEQAVAHFRKKIAGSVRGSAQVLIELFARLGRYDEAIQVSLECLEGESADGCPSAIQLCQKAGDYRRLSELARKDGDLLGFAAGVIQSPLSSSSC